MNLKLIALGSMFSFFSGVMGMDDLDKYSPLPNSCAVENRTKVLEVADSNLLQIIVPYKDLENLINGARSGHFDERLFGHFLQKSHFINLLKKAFSNGPIAPFAIVNLVEHCTSEYHLLLGNEERDLERKPETANERKKINADQEPLFKILFANIPLEFSPLDSEGNLKPYSDVNQQWDYKLCKARLDYNLCKDRTEKK